MTSEFLPSGEMRSRAPASTLRMGELGSVTWLLVKWVSLPAITYHQPSGPLRTACPPCSAKSSGDAVEVFILEPQQRAVAHEEKIRPVKAHSHAAALGRGEEHGGIGHAIP